MNGTVVVVGASVAGVRAAQALRAEGHQGRIVLVDAESEIPCDKPPLSKQFLSGEWDSGRLRLLTPEEARNTGLELRLGAAAQRLDPAARRLELADGSEIAYEACVLATGASARPSPWAAISGVHVVRTLDDATALRDDLRAGGPVVVVGGGFIGAETAPWSIHCPAPSGAYSAPPREPSSPTCTPAMRWPPDSATASPRSPEGPGTCRWCSTTARCCPPTPSSWASARSPTTPGSLAPGSAWTTVCSVTSTAALSTWTTCTRQATSPAGSTQGGAGTSASNTGPTPSTRPSPSHTTSPTPTTYGPTHPSSTCGAISTTGRSRSLAARPTLPATPWWAASTARRPGELSCSPTTQVYSPPRRPSTGRGPWSSAVG